MKLKTQDNDPVRQMISAKAILAPMSGITDIPFRMMARKFGCAFAFTEMMDINGIVYNNRKTFRLMETVPGDSPLGIQIVGQDIDKLLHVAKVCEQKGFKILDINAGCPARKVVKGGKGSALLKDPAKLGKIVKTLVKELSIPVTVKIRSGWDKENLNYLEVARIVAQEGASAICIHTRTKEQMYKGKADHEITGILKKELSIPILASGNIFNADDAASILEETGCDGVFIARGALGRPWIFREINDRLAGKTPPESPNFSEIKNIMTEHFSMCLEHYNEALATRRMYKYMAWYLKPFRNLDAIMREYRSRPNGLEAFKDFIKQLCADEKNRLEI